MAENLDVTNLHITKQKKRKVDSDDGEMLFIAGENVQTLTNVENENYSTALELPILPSAYDRSEGDFDELLLDIPLLDQYVHLLIEECKAWKLEESDLVLMADYQHNDGKIKLKKKLIILNEANTMCTLCSSSQCLHCQAMNKCTLLGGVSLCESCTVNNTIYYTPQLKSLLLIESVNKFHFFYNKEGKWFCDTCTGLCKMKNEISPILPNLEPQTEELSELNYSTVSLLPIPAKLDGNLITIYDQQLSKGCELPIQILPEACYCNNGYPFNTRECLKLERTGVIIYTENDVLDLKDHQIFSSICNGRCKCKAIFEGHNNLLMNLNNRYLIHYALLFDYSELMTLSRNTLHGYVRLPLYTDMNAVENTIEKCNKIYPKHQRLSPGLLVMVCRHKICYGFEIMRERESTVMVYNMLLKKFKTPPRIIVYDNACNLHNTC